MSIEIEGRVLFISRAGADDKFASEVAGILKEAGFKVILQQWDFANKNFMDQIHEALQNASAVVALLSPEYLKSEYCRSEWTNAIAGDPLNRKGRLVLLRVAECEPPGLLAGLAYWDLVQICDNRPLLADVVRKAVLEDHHDATPIAGPYWRAPRTIVDGEATRSIPSFVGRESELATLSAALNESNSNVVLHGLGGTGKSALAREYARRHCDNYSVVWWLNAQTEGGIIDRLIALGSIFVIGLDRSADRHDAAQQVINTLLSGFVKPVLLIFDNLENEVDLAKWRPRQGAKLLATSRKSNWGGDIVPISVDSWPIEDATHYLRRESGRKDLTDDDARAIAEKLGGLPLALAHAAAFLKNRKNVTATSYLERIAIRMDSAPSGVEYPRSVFATFQEQLTRAESEAPGAAALMCLVAFFASDAIPEELFQQSPETYPEDLRPTVSSEPARDLRYTILDQEKLEEAIGALDNLSLIEFSVENRTFRVHRLVQAAARQLLGEAAASWGEAAITALDAAFPDVEYSNWERCGRLVQHVQAIAEVAGDRTLSSYTDLLFKAARYLFERAQYHEGETLAAQDLAITEKYLVINDLNITSSLRLLAMLIERQGRYNEAEPLYIRSLAIRERLLGAHHPDVATSLNSLAGLYESQGRYNEVEPLYIRSLAIRERVLGAGHPDVAMSLDSLAGLYQSQGRYTEAEPLYVRSLAILESMLGAKHSHVATSLNNLAALYVLQGRYNEAEPLYVRSLAIRERLLGAHHPDVATSLNNLAALYVLQGRYNEAEPLYVRSLAIWESMLGAEHPDVAASLNNLAALYESQGRYNEAEPLYIRSLTIWERVLGAEHPRVATSLNNLAGLYQSQGRYNEAEPLYVRSLAILESMLGAEHPDVAASLNNLAALYKSQGRYNEVEPLYTRSLAIRKRALGEGHPDVAMSLNNLAGLYQSQGRYNEAEPLYIRSLAILEPVLGAEHPDVATSLSNLAILYESQGRYNEAEPRYIRSLAIRERVLGAEHPHVATILNKLAELYRSQGRYTEAEPLLARALAIRERNL